MKYVYCIFPILLLLLIHTKTASAHVLISDKNIGALLHVDPNDDPIIAKQSTFFFEIKDKEDKFRLDLCNCRFVVSENGKELYTSSLYSDDSQENTGSATAFYTFETKGVYQVEINGTPKTAGAFQPFHLIWDFRVVNEQQNEVPARIESNSYVKNGVFLVAGIIGVVLCLIFFLRKSKNSTER